MKEKLISVGTCVLVLVHIFVHCQDLLPPCSNMTKEPIFDISAIYECKPLYDPTTGFVKCAGSIDVQMGIERKLILRVLEDVPSDVNNSKVISRCVGIVNISVTDLSLYWPAESMLMTYMADFNSSLSVGVFYADQQTWESGGYCSISILKNVLDRELFGNSSMPWLNRFWTDFTSPLYGFDLKWIQGLTAAGWLSSASLGSLQSLQNASLQTLNVSGMVEENQEVFIKNMPFLKKIVLDSDNISSFHQDNFIGTPEVEELIIRGTNISAVPESIIRLGKLRKLELSYNDDTELFNISNNVLSSLVKLESLTFVRVLLGSISGQLPYLPELKSMTLRECHIPIIKLEDILNFPQLEELDLSVNLLTSLDESTFVKNPYLHFVDLSQNMLTNWPLLYGCSIKTLNLSQNSISYLTNLGKIGTTVEFLNISRNKIVDWHDKSIFTGISLTDVITDFNAHNPYKQDIENEGDSYGTKEYLINGLDNERKSHMIARPNVNEKKLINRLPLSTLSRPQAHSSNAKFSRNLTSNKLWLRNLDLSYNIIAGLSEIMIRSLNGMQQLDLGGNHFDCVDCRMIPFQKWLNTTSTTVNNIGTRDPLFCSSPLNIKGIPIVQVQFDEEPCLDRRTSWWAIIGIPFGAAFFIVSSALGVLYSFRSQITYILHLYKTRRRAKDFTGTVYDKYAFDAFVCYSSENRRFVLTQLAPLLEKSPEKYVLCLHERDFTLGSRIVENIVGSIQYSRKTILVLSEHFIGSKWCRWEMEMANHKMFHEDEHFLILIQLEKLERRKLPRHLQFLMDTRTYLEWSSSSDTSVMYERLKEALGPSIFQKTCERAPLLADVMEGNGYL